MTGEELANKALDIATNYKTLYVMGCIGAPLNKANKERYINHHPYNQTPERKKMINSATASTFGFDCVNLIKAICWGWCGDKDRAYGGAKYNGGILRDISADGLGNIMVGKTDQNWAAIEPGCVVWMPGHVGIYVGEGRVVECTPAWDNCVQITGLGKIPGFENVSNKKQNWAFWGKIPDIEYSKKYTMKIPTSEARKLPAIYDIVYFKGGKHYASCDAKIGFNARPGYAKVFNTAPGAKHPVSLIHSDESSNVYGWVDKEDIQERK